MSSRTNNQLTYSGKQVNRAGDCLIKNETYETNNNEMFNKAFEILSFWRFLHAKPLENALEKIQPIVKKIDSEAIYAKRLKRYVSIVGKLDRFPKMKLKNMQDIGGARVVVKSNKKVAQVVRELKRLPEFKFDNTIRQKNYIEKPKDDGYRSHHIIGQFLDDEKQYRRVEIQVRSRIQHYWATALEIIDLFTKQSLKTNQGEQMWAEFFRNVSTLFAIMDDIHMFDDLSQAEKVTKFALKIKNNKELLRLFYNVCDMCEQLKVREKLNAFAVSLQTIEADIESVSDNGYVLVKIDIVRNKLEYTIFPNGQSKNAEQMYTDVEKDYAEKNKLKREHSVVALVYTNAVGGVKEAYPNYFADSSKFMGHIAILFSVERVFKPTVFEKIFG